MNNENWIIRPAVGDDLSFIYSTWSRSYRYDSPVGRACKNSTFFKEYNRIIDYILSQPDTKVLVAAKPDEPNVFFGYIVGQPGILHYVFVKEAFLIHGIAKALFEELGSPAVYTHKTMNARVILNKHPEMTFNPFLLYKQERPKDGEN